MGNAYGSFLLCQFALARFLLLLSTDSVASKLANLLASPLSRALLFFSTQKENSFIAKIKRDQ